MSDIRRAPRVSYDRAVKVRCESWNEFEQLHATNLSRQGIFLATDHPAPVLTPINIELQLPDGQSLVLRGRVAHTVTPARAGALNTTAGMGVELVDVTADVQNKLAQLVRRSQQAPTEKPIAPPAPIRSAATAATTRPPSQPPRAPDPGPQAASRDEVAALEAYLEDLRHRDFRAILEIAPGADNATIVRQYQTLSHPFEPARFSNRPAEVRVVAAEIAILFRRALDALTAQPQLPRSRTVPPPLETPKQVRRPSGGLSASALFKDMPKTELGTSKPIEGAATTSSYMRSPLEWHRLGVALLRAQRYREARDLIRRALDGDPTNRLYQRDHTLASALELRSSARFEDAAELLLKVLSLDAACQDATVELRALVDQKKVRKSSAIAKVIGG